MAAVVPVALAIALELSDEHSGIIELDPKTKVDLAMLLIVFAEVVYLMLDWRLGAVMLVVSVGFYFVGAAMPLWLNVTLFVVGWIFQFLGHSVYEKKSPAFLTNALHLLVGPLWILNDVVPVVK